MIDFDNVRKLAQEHRPKLIVAGASAYPRTVETDKFREIADEIGAILMVDMAHIAGLVAPAVIRIRWSMRISLRLRRIRH